MLDAAADLVRFLGACPEVKMLVTSRSPLHVPGEREFLVPPLDVPKPRSELSVEEVQRSPAVRLFLDRAQAVRANFVLTSGNAVAVVAICWRLDGIPLAIELAAALAKALPVETLDARLTDCLRLPTPGNRAGVPRQQTLRATIDWGYDLLTDPERILFRRLAVFSGGFTLEAAEVVCTGPMVETPDVLALLVQLVDKSFVVPREQGGAARYHLLETLRQYGWERLVEAGEANALRDRHQEWCQVVAQPWEREWWGPNERAWLDRIAQSLLLRHSGGAAGRSWANCPADRRRGGGQ